MSEPEIASTSTRDLPFVVACMPAYQSAEFISQTLNSVLNQDYPNLRIFISVDVCEDDTYQICRQFQRQHPQITLFQQTERQGWLNNTNFLFNKVDDPFFFYMQHDDVIQPQYVSRIMASLTEVPNAVLGYSDMVRHHYQLPDQTECFEQMDLSLNARQRMKMLLSSSYWYVVFRGIVSLEAFQAVGSLKRNNNKEFSADFIWLMKLAYQGPFVRVPEPLYKKFVLETSLAESWRGGWIKYFRMSQFAARSILSMPLPLHQKLGLVCSSWRAFSKKVVARMIRGSKGR